MRLIVNADDLGSSEGHNEAIYRSFKEGHCSSATIMSNMPGFAAAAERAVKEGLPVGIHINLTAGQALSESIRKCDRFCSPDGAFREKGFRHIYRLNIDERNAVVEEVRAQIRGCREAGLTLTHADSHNHIHEEPGVIKAIIWTLKSEGIPCLRLARNAGNRRSILNLVYRRYVNRLIANSGLRYTDAFGSTEDYEFEARKGNEVGLFEVMVHPSMRDGELLDAVTGRPMEEIARSWGDRRLVSFKDMAPSDCVPERNVLFLMHLPPPCHGAAMMGSYIRDSRLISDKFKTFFINISTSVTLDEIGRRSFAKLFRYLSVWSQLLGYLVRNGRPDIIFVTPAVRGAGLIKELPVLLFIRMLGRPFAVQLHNKGLKEYLSGHPFLSRLVKWLFGYRGAHAITVSRRLMTDIDGYFRPENMHAIPYGIPEVDTTYMHQPRSGRKLIFLGNLIVTKGLYVYLDACRALKIRGVEFEAEIVGGEADVSKETLLSAIAERGLADLCKYRGPLYGDEKLRALGDADIFVFPTYYPYETFGLVNLEAMACGMPVISTAEGAIPDIVQDGVTGYIVPSVDPDEIAQVIEGLISDKDLCRRMGAEGRQRVLKHYTVDKYCDRITALLIECISDV